MRRTCLIGVAVAFALPLAAAWAEWAKELPAGQTLAELPMDLGRAGAVWEVGPGLSVVRDEVLGREVVAHAGRAVGFLRTRQPVDGPCAIEALVRIAEQQANHHGATLAIGVTGEGSRPESAYALAAVSSPRTGRFCLRLTPTLGSGARRMYQDSRATRQSSVKIPWPRTITVGDRFTKISPVWDEAFRREIEAAMARVPLVHSTWFRLRVEHGRDGVRLFKDGMLVAERRPAGRVQGDAGLWLRGNVRVASRAIRRLGEERP